MKLFLLLLLLGSLGCISTQHVTILASRKAAENCWHKLHQSVNKETFLSFKIQDLVMGRYTPTTNAHLNRCKRLELGYQSKLSSKLKVKRLLYRCKKEQKIYNELARETSSILQPLFSFQAKIKLTEINEHCLKIEKAIKDLAQLNLAEQTQKSSEYLESTRQMVLLKVLKAQKERILMNKNQIQLKLNQIPTNNESLLFQRVRQNNTVINQPQLMKDTSVDDDQLNLKYQKQSAQLQQEQQHQQQSQDQQQQENDDESQSENDTRLKSNSELYQSTRKSSRVVNQLNQTKDWQADTVRQLTNDEFNQKSKEEISNLFEAQSKIQSLIEKEKEKVSSDESSLSPIEEDVGNDPEVDRKQPKDKLNSAAQTIPSPPNQIIIKTVILQPLEDIAQPKSSHATAKLKSNSSKPTVSPLSTNSIGSTVQSSSNISVSIPKVQNNVEVTKNQANDTQEPKGQKQKSTIPIQSHEQISVLAKTSGKEIIIKDKNRPPLPLKLQQTSLSSETESLSNKTDQTKFQTSKQLQSDQTASKLLLPTNSKPEIVHDFKKSKNYSIKPKSKLWQEQTDFHHTDKTSITEQIYDMENVINTDTIPIEQKAPIEFTIPQIFPQQNPALKSRLIGIKDEKIKRKRNQPIQPNFTQGKRQFSDFDSIYPKPPTISLENILRNINDSTKSKNQVHSSPKSIPKVKARRNLKEVQNRQSNANLLEQTHSAPKQP